MADGLIPDDEKNSTRNAQMGGIGGPGGSPYAAPVPSAGQALGAQNYPAYPAYPAYPSPSSPFPSPYVVSPLDPLSSSGYYAGAPPAYQTSQGQYPYGNIQQPQPPQYGQINDWRYQQSLQQQPPPPQALNQASYPPVFQQFEGKEVVPRPGPSNEQNAQTELPPDYMSSDIVNPRFTPVTLHGDDHDHVVKALVKAGDRDQAMLSGIVGTYMERKRTHEKNRLQQPGGLQHPSIRHTTRDVALYNDLMDKLEHLSGSVLTKHRHALNAEPWIAALNPHRRAIFAELYNTNQNVRGFCSGVDGGPTMFPQLDDWALGKRDHRSLSFQRAGRRGPNWNVALELLSQVRTVILLDDSGSMAAPGHMSWSSGGGYGDYYASRNQSRWDQARELLAGIAPLVSRHSRYGLDVHFLNHAVPFLGLRSADDVQQAFRAVRPGGGTPTGRRVNDLLDGYMCALRYNRALMPLNLIVITDGEAQDEWLLHRAIEEHVTKIVHRGFQAHQFGMEFLQVGDDEDATRHLEKLEEEVSRHHHSFQRDVVGVTPTTRMTGMGPERLLGIVLGGIDARMNGYMRARGVNV